MLIGLVSKLALYVYEVFEAKKFSMVEVTQTTFATRHSKVIVSLNAVIL